MKQIIKNFMTAASVCAAVMGGSLTAYADEPTEQVAAPGGNTLSYAGASSHTARFARAEMTCATEGAEIHYELYDTETVNGNYPEVTLDSPKFDPENPQIWLNCTPGRTYGIRARAFKDGMQPSVLKAGAFLFIYNECSTLKELMTLPTGKPNPNFPICCTATVTVTHFLDYLKSTSYYQMDRNFLYVQDDEMAIAIQYYDGSLNLQPGDQITDLCVQRYESSSGVVTFAFSGGSKDSRNKINFAPRKVGHVDLQPREVTPYEVKDQPNYYLLKVTGIEDVDYSGEYFEMQYKDKWVPKATLRGYHNDPSLREHLEESTPYDVIGLKYNAMLYFLSAEKHVAIPRIYPRPEEDETEVVVPSNQPIYIACRDAGAKIYYTLDGSEPTEKSTLYTGPFTIPAEPMVTVRYAAYGDSGLLPSEGLAVTYERDGRVTVPFDFSNPASLNPALEDPADGEISLTEPLEFTSDAEGVTVKLTLTPYSGKSFRIARDDDGQVMIELPMSSNIKVESSHAIKGISYRCDSESARPTALRPTDEGVTGAANTREWTIGNGVPDHYTLNFSSGSVSLKPANFETLLVNVDPLKENPDKSGITDVQTDGSVRVDGRNLLIDGYAGVVFTVYDMLGRALDRVEADGSSLNHTLNLPSGIYLLGRSDGREALKISVR